MSVKYINKKKQKNKCEVVEACVCVCGRTSEEHSVTLFMLLHRYRQHPHKRDPVNALLVYNAALDPLHMHMVPSPTRGDHTEGLGHPGPRWSQRDESFDVFVFPGLWLLVEEVQRVHVSHAVSDQHHGPASLLRHLLDHLLQRQEILFILIW